MGLFKKMCPFGHIPECGLLCAIFNEDTGTCGLLHKVEKQKTAKEKVQSVNKADMDEVLEYFCVAYNAVTDNDYIVKKSDFILVANLLKQTTKEVIKSKIDAMKALIGNIWFMSTAADFNIGKLNSQFNQIIIDGTRTSNDAFSKELSDRGIV